MKRFFAIAVLSGIAFFQSASLFAGSVIVRIFPSWGTVEPGTGGGDGGAVGAPLDGGLLALLAAAGVTYFTARKKKKKAE